MFAQEDLSSVDEVLLWRRYAYNLVHHNVNVYAAGETMAWVSLAAL